MTLLLHDAVDHNGLFDILGVAFAAIDTLNTARATTVPEAVEAILAQVELIPGATLEYEEAVDGFPSAVSSWQTSGSSLASTIATACSNLVIQFVAEDSRLIDNTLRTSLEYLVAAMNGSGSYVDANAVAISLTAGGSNAGDLAVCYTDRGGDGQVLQASYAETIELTVSASQSGSTQLQAVGERSVTAALGQDWPAGSGCRTSISSVDASNSLLSNGDFEDWVNGAPSDWIVAVGTLGATISATTTEQQEVTISGTPTGGFYVLVYTDGQGVAQATDPISYDAAAATVQTELRKLTGLEQVTVASSGTAPNYAHTVTFTGAIGVVPQLTSLNYLTGGTSPSIAHSTTVAGDAGSYRGTALRLTSNGSQLTTLYHALTALSSETVYFCHFRVRLEGSGSSGELRVELLNGIGGSVLQDPAGNACTYTIDPLTLSNNTYLSRWFSFRLPKTARPTVYLRIRVVTPLPVGQSLCIDEMAIAAGSALYAGGPWVTAFRGATDAAVGDSWTMAVTNDRGGSFQTWFDRVFDMTGKGLLLPTSGSTLIPDSLIATPTTVAPTTAAPTTATPTTVAPTTMAPTTATPTTIAPTTAAPTTTAPTTPAP